MKLEIGLSKEENTDGRGEHIAGTVLQLCGTTAPRPQTVVSRPQFVNEESLAAG
jgi:hypothetical protein